MRIPHRELDQITRDFGQWLQRRSSSHYIPTGYEGCLKLGIYRFHKTDDFADAERHLRGIFDRASDRLTNQSRVEAAFERLRSYVDWYKGSDITAIEHRVRIEFPFEPSHILSGEISRIDATDYGYRGILLGKVEPGWKSELRFPLLQSAVARHYQIPVDDTLVGVQETDGSHLEEFSFSASERAAALRRLIGLGRRLGPA